MYTTLAACCPLPSVLDHIANLKRFFGEPVKASGEPPQYQKWQRTCRDGSTWFAHSWDGITAQRREIVLHPATCSPGYDRWLTFVVEQGSPDPAVINGRLVMIDGHTTVTVTGAGFQRLDGDRMTPVAYRLQRNVSLGTFQCLELTGEHRRGNRLEWDAAEEVPTVRLPLALGMLRQRLHPEMEIAWYRPHRKHRRHLVEALPSQIG